MGFEGIKVGDEFRLRSGRKVPIYAHDRRHMLPDEILTITAVSPEYERVTAVINAPGYETKKCNFKAHGWFNQTFERTKKTEAKPPMLRYCDLSVGDKIRLLPGKTMVFDAWVQGVGCVPHHVGQQEILTVTGQPNAATFIVQDQVGQAFVVEHSVERHDIGKFVKVTTETPVSEKNLEFSDLKVGDLLKKKPGCAATVSAFGRVDGQRFKVDNTTVIKIEAIEDGNVLASGNIPRHEGQSFPVTAEDWFHRFERVVPETKPLDLKAGDKIQLQRGRRSRLGDHDVQPGEILTILEIRPDHLYAAIATERQVQAGEYTSLNKPEWFRDYEKVHLPETKPMDLKPGDQIRLRRGRKAKLGGVEVRPDDILTIMGIGSTVGLASVATAQQLQDHEYATVQNPEWFKDFEKVDGKAEMTKKPKAAEKISATFTWDTLEVGDTLEVKPPPDVHLPRTDFTDRAGTHEDLPAGTIVWVTAKNDQQFILRVKTGAENIRGREFTVNSEELHHWLAKFFIRVGHEKVEEVKKKRADSPPDSLMVGGKYYARVEHEETDMPADGKITFDDLKVGDRFMVKPGTRPMPFADDTDLPDGTIVRVKSLGDADWGDEGTINFSVTHCKQRCLRGRIFSTINTVWLDNKFTRFSEEAIQEDTMMKTPVSMKETTTMFKVSVANRKATEAVKQGLKQAGARMAHKALIAQVEKAFGRKFPKAFFSTPAGKAMLDLGSCYLVMMATEMVPGHPLAMKANEVAALALTAATYDHAVPLIEVATRLIEGAAGIDILGK